MRCNIVIRSIFISVKVTSVREAAAELRHYDSTVAQNEDLPCSCVSQQGRSRTDEEVIKWVNREGTKCFIRKATV